MIPATAAMTRPTNAAMSARLAALPAKRLDRVRFFMIFLS
jgi:hypothetical protein